MYRCNDPVVHHSSYRQHSLQTAHVLGDSYWYLHVYIYSWSIHCLHLAFFAMDFVAPVEKLDYVTALFTMRQLDIQ